MAIRSIRRLLFAVVMILALSAASYAQVAVGVAVSFGPPPLPVYVQPPCPAEGYLWTPGYWAWDPEFGDYYWVPGTWVLAPEVGFFWTPGYWAWSGGNFVFYEGYWGPVVGFYGGINYGFGFFGEGFVGGRWDNGRFFYNRAVTNVSVTNITNVYNNTTVINRTENRVSFNGGNGGVQARPTREQEAAAHERHIPPVAAQTQHIQAARSNPQLRASANNGKPSVAATAKPGAFSGRDVVPAKQAGGSWKPPANRPAPGGNKSGGNKPGSESWRNVQRPGGSPVHPSELPARERPAPQSSGNPKQDQKYQQQQQKLYTKQDQERQKLQQKQEQEHQRLDRQKVDDTRRQQVEQQHQQQTQQLQQKHEQQQQKLQSQQQPRERSNQSKPPKEEKPH